MARTYTMRQGSYFRPLEWQWLQKAVLDTDVQEWIARKDYANARAVLVTGFRGEFTTPPPGETDAAFKKRRQSAKKSRKENIVRIRAETEEEFQTRMEKLPDRIGVWLANWRHQKVASGGKRWQPPPATLPVMRKPRTITPFDAFCKRGPSPKGLEFVDKCCNLGELRAARKAAWEKLSPEEQEDYRTVAIALMVEAEPAADIMPEGVDIHTPEVVARAEDIAEHVDRVIGDLHESVGWGGLAIVGGPDENGEGRIHIKGIGTNRNGETFLEVLLKAMGWTALEFDTFFSIWVEQCREGPEAAPSATFTETARRAMEYVCAQGSNPGNAPPFASAVTLASDAMAEWAKLPAPVFRFPVCNYVEQDAIARQQHIMFNALQNMSLTMSGNHGFTSSASTTHSSGDVRTSTQALQDGHGGAANSDDELPPLEVDGDVAAPDFPPPGHAPLVRDDVDTFSSALVNYDPMCVDVNCRPVFEPREGCMTGRPDCVGAMGLSTEGEVQAMDALAQQTEELTLTLQDQADMVNARRPTGGARAKVTKATEPSGVPMPGALGAPVIFRPTRARSTKSRQDTADGTLPLTASKRGN